MISWDYILSGASGDGGLIPQSAITGAPEGAPEIPLRMLALDASGDVLVPFRWIVGGPAVAQLIYSRFRLWRREWFLDQRIGMPYRERIFVKGTPLPIVLSIFREVIRTTPYVRGVQSLSSRTDRATRRLELDFVAKLSDGSSVNARGAPFIIEV